MWSDTELLFWIALGGVLGGLLGILFYVEFGIKSDIKRQGYWRFGNFDWRVVGTIEKRNDEWR